jgi:tetratricopeptide (TPR) repeat protein
VLHLASTLAEAGKSAESEILMGRYRQMRPPQAPKDLMRFLSLTPEQQRADYRARVESAVREHPEDPIAQAQYLKLSLEEGQMHQAAAAASAIEKLRPGAAVLADAGRAMLAARQYALARSLLEKAVAADPSAGLEVDLAIAVFQTGGATEGLRLLERVPASRRGAPYYLARAQMLAASDKPEEGIAAMNRAIEASPKDPELYWQLAILLRRHQRGKDALALLSKAAQAMPQEPQIPVIRATLHELSGGTDEALAQLEPVQQRWPEFAAAWVARGMIQAAHSHYAEARQALGTAVSLGARSPEALAHFADSILRSEPGKTGEAQAAIDQALRLTPGDPWVQKLAAAVRQNAAGPVDSPDPRRLFELRPPREW